MRHKQRPVENWTIAFVNRCLEQGEKIDKGTLLRWIELWNLHHALANECIRFNPDANRIIAYET